MRIAPDKELQTDKVKLSGPLHSQKPRQLAFAAELERQKHGELNAFGVCGGIST